MASSVFLEKENENKNLPASSVLQKSGLRNDKLSIFGLMTIWGPAITYDISKTNEWCYKEVEVYVYLIISLFLSSIEMDHVISETV